MPSPPDALALEEHAEKWRERERCVTAIKQQAKLLASLRQLTGREGRVQRALYLQHQIDALNDAVRLIRELPPA